MLHDHQCNETCFSFDAHDRLKGAGVCDEAQVFATRCEIPFNNRQTKISCRSLRFASDLGSEAKRNESAMIGGFPWETRHNYQSMMTFYMIIFLMMTHHHWINEAMIIELMIV